jgi:hypothetical protein
VGGSALIASVERGRAERQKDGLPSNRKLSAGGGKFNLVDSILLASLKTRFAIPLNSFYDR